MAVESSEAPELLTAFRKRDNSVKEVKSERLKGASRITFIIQFLTRP
jgi:hypothetical protein